MRGRGHVRASGPRLPPAVRRALAPRIGAAGTGRCVPTGAVFAPAVGSADVTTATVTRPAETAARMGCPAGPASARSAASSRPGRTNASDSSALAWTTRLISLTERSAGRSFTVVAPLVLSACVTAISLPQPSGPTARTTRLLLKAGLKSAKPGGGAKGMSLCSAVSSVNGTR